MIFQSQFYTTFFSFRKNCFYTPANQLKPVGIVDASHGGIDSLVISTKNSQQIRSHFLSRMNRTNNLFHFPRKCTVIRLGKVVAGSISRDF